LFELFDGQAGKRNDLSKGAIWYSLFCHWDRGAGGFIAYLARIHLMTASRAPTARKTEPL